MEPWEHTLEQEFSEITFGRPHAVILGAGASVGAFPRGDKRGRRLPVMADLAESLGLGPEVHTKRVILEIYDAMVEAERTGVPYQTRLDPPPADPRAAHPGV